MTTSGSSRDDARRSPHDGSWCGVGFTGGHPTIWKISKESDIAPYTQTGDRIVAFRDQRFSDEWMPQEMMGQLLPLRDGKAGEMARADIPGPSGTRVSIRIARADGSVVEVEAFRRAFFHGPDPRTGEMGIHLIAEGTKECPALVSELQQIQRQLAKHAVTQRGGAMQSLLPFLHAAKERSI